MKSFALLGAAALLLGSIAGSGAAFAQTIEKTTTTTTTTSGAIGDIGPDTFVVRTETSPTPVPYTYSKTTTYVDENGNPVSIETVKSGLPVTVHYTEEAGRRVATKVVVRRHTDSTGKTTIQEERTTTTTP